MFFKRRYTSFLLCFPAYKDVGFHLKLELNHPFPKFYVNRLFWKKKLCSQEDVELQNHSFCVNCPISSVVCRWLIHQKGFVVRDKMETNVELIWWVGYWMYSNYCLKDPRFSSKNQKVGLITRKKGFVAKWKFLLFLITKYSNMATFSACSQVTCSPRGVVTSTPR